MMIWDEKKDELSDVNVVLDEDEAAVCTSSRSGQKKQAAEEAAPKAHQAQGSAQRTSIPGHSMVLVAFSTFFKAKLRSWSEGLFPKPEVRLSVPAGQLELGERLLQAMYEPQPALEALSQAQLLQLLVLADRYGVNKQELRQQLGDLELALSDSQKRQRLLALPHNVLLLLLQDEETKAAAENTVFRVIEGWHGHQQQHCSGPSDAELVQLLRQIRMQHCTQPFVATVLSESPLAAKCFSPTDLRMACICSNPGGAPAKQFVAGMLAQKHPSIVKFLTWQLPQRPASEMTKLSMQHEVSLEELRQELQALQLGASHRVTLFETQRWQGEQFTVQMELASGVQLAGGKDKEKVATDSKLISSGPFKVGLYIGVKGEGSNLLRLLSCKMTVTSYQPFGRASSFSSPEHTLSMSKAGVSCLPMGWVDFFGYGSVDGWAAFEVKLRASNLVHAGNCLQVQLDVTELL